MSIQPSFRSQPEQRTQDLLTFAANGDEDAWRVLYGRYRMMLLTEARMHLRAQVKSRVDAEDLVQSAFLSAWDQIGEFEYQGEGSFRRWLARLVINRARDRLRRARTEDDRLHPRGREQVVAGGPAQESDAALPEDVVAKLEEEQQILETLEELPSHEREVVLLKNFENKSWIEVGEVMGIPERSARRHYVEAVRHMARALRARRHPGGPRPQ